MRIPALAVTLVVASLANPLCAQGPTGPAEPCEPPALIPTGVHSDPGELFAQEHYQVTAGMSLQGNRQKVKYAPVMVPWNQLADPMDPNGNIADFQTVYIINNPDPNLPLTVDVDFFNADGTLSASVPDLVIAPNGHYQREVGEAELYGPYGMIRVQVDDASLAPYFVGATSYFATQVVDPLDLEAPLHRLGRPMSSMQPLQQLQSQPDNTVSFGPVPVRHRSGIDSLNGLLSFYNLCNPSKKDDLIAVTVSSPIAAPVTSFYALPANGTISVFDAWNYAVSNYPTLMQDHDIVVEFESIKGMPILGEAILLDVYGGSASGTVGSGGSGSGSGTGSGGAAAPGGGGGPEGVMLGTLFERARMSTMMLGYSPTSYLVNPELTDGSFADPSPMQTTMGVTNVSGVDVGPVTVDYFDNLGALIASDTIASLPPLGSFVIGSGLFQTPNYPSTGVFKGSAHIRACNGNIIGWANRASENRWDSPHDDAPKMYGELLHRAGGAEHKIGWIQNTLRTKVAPLVLHDLVNVLPSYVTYANHRVSNTNAHAFSFFDYAGNATGFAAYVGLPIRTTSFSYLESLITVAAPGMFSDMHHHAGLIQNRTGSIEGIQTIGGRIDFFLRFEGGLPNYPGPGDTVGF